MAKIKRFGVIKTASFLGLYGVFIGFIFGIVMFIVSSIVGDMSSISSNVIISGLSGWMYILLVPLGYGVLFFLAGLIFTPIMNLTLKIVKGLDLDIEMEEEQPAEESVEKPVQKPAERPAMASPKLNIKPTQKSVPVQRMQTSQGTQASPRIQTPRVQ